MAQYVPPASCAAISLQGRLQLALEISRSASGSLELLFGSFWQIWCMVQFHGVDSRRFASFLLHPICPGRTIQTRSGRFFLEDSCLQELDQGFENSKLWNETTDDGYDRKLLHTAQSKKWEASSGIRRFAPCAPATHGGHQQLQSIVPGQSRTVVSRWCSDADPVRYTLATGLFRDINKCIRDDNEDGLRRLALPWVSFQTWGEY